MLISKLQIHSLFRVCVVWVLSQTPLAAETLTFRLGSPQQLESIDYSDKKTTLNLSSSEQKSLRPLIQIGLEELSFGKAFGSIQYESSQGQSDGVFSKLTRFSLGGINKTLWNDTSIHAIHRYDSLALAVSPKTPVSTSPCTLRPHLGLKVIQLNLSLIDQTNHTTIQTKEWVPVPLAGGKCLRPITNNLNLFGEVSLGYLNIRDQEIQVVDNSLGLSYRQNDWTYSFGTRFDRLSLRTDHSAYNLSLSSRRSLFFVGLSYTFGDR